jgi:hypothetical protein
MARHVVDPRQSKLFDVYESILSPVAYRRLKSSWHFLFRQVILELMPVGPMGEHFDECLGRPTKELYSLAGLLLIKEFRNWTNLEAADAYMFDVSLQYALNLSPEQQSLCERTVERYNKLFRHNALAAEVMQQVTCRLVELLQLDVSQQRLDSTHVHSNMAQFGRMKLMATAIRRFLTQLKRHDEAGYQALPEPLRQRYEQSDHSIFGWKTLDDDGVRQLRQQIAEDLAWLVEHFRRDKQHHGRSTYQALLTVFEQQCEVIDDKVQVRAKTGGDIICNPSDPDATLDGHKGSGYQVQISETCGDANEVQLIVAAMPQTACESDAKALAPVIDQLQQQGLTPKEMLADTSYGSDGNFVHCVEKQIDLISPTCGKAPDKHTDQQALTEADFEIEEYPAVGPFQRPETHLRCTACPAGKTPHRSHYDAFHQHITVLQSPEVCKTCPLAQRCPKRFANGWMIVTIKAKQVRLIARRRREQTKEFRDKYRRRSGIEATNSLLKRVTGLGRLRVRGQRAVFMSLYLKIAGWNILRAATVRALRALFEENGSDKSKFGQIAQAAQACIVLLTPFKEFQIPFWNPAPRCR